MTLGRPLPLLVLSAVEREQLTTMAGSRSLPHVLGSGEKPRNRHCEESWWVEVWRGNDDEAICAPAPGEGKSRLLRRAPHPASPLRTPRNDTNWALSTVPNKGE